MLRPNDPGPEGEADTAAATAGGGADESELPAWQPVYQTARPSVVQLAPP